jgi:hypothetical protein
LGCLALGCLVLGGCQKTPLGDRQPTFPVTGQVIIDGEPAGKVLVKAHPRGKLDEAHPIFPQAITDDQGRFSLFTYDVGDGVPNGDYALTLVWGRVNGARYSGPDKLRGRYADPQRPVMTFQVAGQPLSLGEITKSSK